MPSFPKPSFTFNYSLATEVGRLRDYRDTAPGRAIPSKANDRVLIATWNIANLGQQERRPRDYQLIAEIISWFDIIAIQETKDDLSGLRAIHKFLPSSWRLLFSDIGGNDERMAFIYDSDKVSALEKVGEIAVPPKDIKAIKLPGITRQFAGFDRNPYLAAFQARNFPFLLVNVHLFFGSESKANIERRALEAYATARWADLRTKGKDAYVTDIIALGDFNLPKVEPGDPIYAALKRRGLERPPHSTQISGSIASDNAYDQIMFFPGATDEEFTGNIGVFDFDGAIFRGIWKTKTPIQFRSYVRYFVSDHRPLWAEFRI
jgi:endonuclease/exonuclease/phosphatase family metal-dependent hydrolase